jgi:Xaa-Pro aminopeptidase
MNTESVSEYFRARRESLQARLATKKISTLIVTHPPNVFYLSGFRGSAGIAIFTATDAALLVDPRYTLQARSQAADMEVIEVKDGLLRAAGRRLRKAGSQRVGFEDTHLTCAEFQTLSREAHSPPRWQPAGVLLEELRAVKDVMEIEQIRHAGKITADAFQEVAGGLRLGVAERDVAAEIEYRMRLHGADGAAFETIVASGSRGALPHARPSDKTLGPGELVIFDLGAVYSGYAADMTRTVYLGSPDRRARSLYQSVLDAQAHAVKRLQAGVRAAEVDAEARSRLARRNLDKLFTHSTGHGVGIEIHEGPRVGKGVKTRISTGNVVTVEPGIYIEGLGGIRIEDTVLVGERSPEILTPASKDRWWIE